MTDTVPTNVDTSDEEKFSVILIQVNIYSNNTGAKVWEAKEIFSAVDKQMFKMNFMRESYATMNLDSGTIYRLIARYEGVASENYFYRR